MSDFRDVVETVALLGALIAAAVQVAMLRRDRSEQDRQRREILTLDLHRDMTVDGETAAAFRRLSVSLRGLGTAHRGMTTWYLIRDADLAPGGLFDLAREAAAQDYVDLYRVLWYLQRVSAARAAGIVDDDFLFALMGFHLWWWNQLLRHLSAPSAMPSVLRLGVAAERWADVNRHMSNWTRRCANDFDGAGAVRLSSTG